MSGKIQTNLNILILGIVIFVFSIVTVLIVIIPEEEAIPEEEVPDYGIAPNFSVLTTDGSNYTLSNDIGKNLIIIDFMATWCNPCLEIGKIYNQTLTDNPETLTIVSITIEKLDTASFLENWRLAWDFYWNFIPYGNYTQNLIKEYKIEVGIPASFFIDLSGIIRVSHLGLLTQKTVNNWLNGIYI